MKENKTLLSFILGILSIIFIIPIIESLVEIICGYLELLKISSTKLVLKGNKDIMDLQVDQQEIATSVIGYDLTSQDDYYNEYDDDFEDKKENKIKLGF